jgi:hypothetical protein
MLPAMSWRVSTGARGYAAALLCAAVLGCGEVPAPPEPTAPPQSVAPGAPAPDVSPFVGDAYDSFIARPGMERFSAAALGLSEADQARFDVANASQRPSVAVSGGGTDALVFYGCAASGCADGVAVVAIDAGTGEAFVGVRDGQGADPLVRNVRLEALLRLGSASGAWDDPNARRTPGSL